MIDSLDSQKSTYLAIEWAGKQYNALLDSGCEVSIVGRRLLPKDIQLEPAETNLLAANRTKIPLLGRIEMDFILGGKTYPAKLAVSSAIDELILGVDFLSKYSVTWSFGAGELYIDGQSFPLQQRILPGRVRWIYAAESVRIPAMARTNISVVVTKPSLQSCDQWMLEPVKICKGLEIAKVWVHSDGSKVKMCVDN